VLLAGGAVVDLLGVEACRAVVVEAMQHSVVVVPRLVLEEQSLLVGQGRKHLCRVVVEAGLYFVAVVLAVEREEELLLS
jgi:hypothetical protein